MNAPLYTKEILRLAGSLPDPAALERIDGRSEQRSPTCGSSVLTEVQLEQDVVLHLSQNVRACAFGQASASLVAQHATGRSRDDIAAALAKLTDWLDGSGEAPAGWGLGALAPARSRKSRHAAILLPFRALLGAIDNIQA